MFFSLWFFSRHEQDLAVEERIQALDRTEQVLQQVQPGREMKRLEPAAFYQLSHMINMRLLTDRLRPVHFCLCARRAHVLTGESPQTALFSGKVTAKVKGGPVKGAWRKMEAKP